MPPVTAYLISNVDEAVLTAIVLGTPVYLRDIIGPLFPSRIGADNPSFRQPSAPFP
jgi:hypothetical protein